MGTRGMVSHRARHALGTTRLIPDSGGSLVATACESPLGPVTTRSGSRVNAQTAIVGSSTCGRDGVARQPDHF